MLSVSAGDFEEAYSSGNNVLVYFSSPSCSTCRKFDSVFNDIKAEHKDIKCVKINVDTRKGLSLFRKYHGLYVPYLIITSSKSKKTVSISISCAMNDICFERVIKDFK